MNKIVIILLLVSSRCLSQDTLYFKTVGLEKYVLHYQIQSSSDKSSWADVLSVTPARSKDSNRYAYSISAGKYYRIVAYMVSGLYQTDAVYDGVSDYVRIVPVSYHHGWFSDYVIWDVYSVTNVGSYTVDSSSDGVNWGFAGTTQESGLTSYKLKFSRFFGKKLMYRVKPVFKDGTVGVPVLFN